MAEPSVSPTTGVSKAEIKAAVILGSAIEDATKAAQVADLLLQDLQSLNHSGGPIVSMLILPEIEKVAGIRARLSALASALTAES